MTTPTPPMSDSEEKPITESALFVRNIELLAAKDELHKQLAATQAELATAHQRIASLEGVMGKIRNRLRGRTGKDIDPAVFIAAIDEALTSEVHVTDLMRLQSRTMRIAEDVLLTITPESLGRVMALVNYVCELKRDQTIDVLDSYFDELTDADHALIQAFTKEGE